MYEQNKMFTEIQHLNVDHSENNSFSQKYGLNFLDETFIGQMIKKD